MTAPPGAALTGLTELAVRARVDAGQVNSVPPAPGRSLTQILRANVLTRFNAILGALFVVVLVIGPPQDALFGAVQPGQPFGGPGRPARRVCRRIAHGRHAGRVRHGLWILVLVAGRPTASRIFLIAAMAAGLVPLFAALAVRRVLALQLPPAGILAAVASVVLAAIAALTLWRRASRSMPDQSPSS